MNGADLPSLDDIDLDGHAVLYKKRSTGTTGPRKTIYYSEGFYFDELFLPVRKMAHLWGIECRADAVTAASLSNARAWDHLLLVDPTGGSGGVLRLKMDERSVDSMDETVRYLARARPALLFGKPSVLAALATFVLQHGLEGTLRPEVVVSSGGALSPEARALITHALRGPVGEVYGTSEAGCVAFTCGEDGPYHVDRTQAHVECGEGAPGPLLATMVANEVMPIQRFDTGDTAVRADGPCRCGRPGPRFAALRGKTSEMLDLGDGRYFDLGRVNLDVLPGASAYRVDASPAAVRVTARLGGPPGAPSAAAAFVREATDRIRALLPRDLRRAPAVLVAVEPEVDMSGGADAPPAAPQRAGAPA